ncbi:MAG: PAS domain-containing protein [Acidimicrobiales bacterium]|nr:PAS domain-containing protein [Acidimicrobiales bacterium]
MHAPLFPADESARLDALARLDAPGTGPDSRFDRLVRVAARALDAPIAVVSLVDHDRQWFEARVGLAAGETPHEVSFCGHTITEPSGQLVVEDAAADERFAGTPLVVGVPHLRAYAGVALRDPRGERIGTFAVLDRRPRRFDERDLAVLADLAAVAEHELSTHDTETAHHELVAVERRTRLAMETFEEGIVFQSPDGRIVDWNTAAGRVLGLSTDELAGRSSIDRRWRCISADGAEWPGDSHPAMVAIRTGAPVLGERMGVYRPNGDLVWMRVNSRPLIDDDGTMLGAFTAFQDITAEVTFEQRTAALAERLIAAIDAGGVGTALLDAAGRVTFVNQALATILDAEPDEMAGEVLARWFHPNDPVQRQFDEVLVGVTGHLSADVCLASDRPTDGLGGIPATADARWIRLNLTRLPLVDDEATMLAQVTDITVRRHLEADLARSEELARVSLDVLEQGVVFASPSAGVMRANPAALRILGYPPGSDVHGALTGHRWDLLDDRLRPLARDEYPVTAAVETGATVRDQVLWSRRRDGAYVRLRVSVMPFGWTDEVVVAFTDITPYTRLGAPRPADVFHGAA